MAKLPKIRVVKRKLGRHRACGFAYNTPEEGVNFGLIEIDPRKEKHGSAFDEFDTHVHEAVHMVDPLLHEDDVAEFSTKLAKILWKNMNFRIVNL